MSGERAQRPMWLRCKCDQYGRCFTDCPSADLPRPSPTAYFDRRRSAWVDRGRGRVTSEPQVIDCGFGAHGQGEASDG